MRESKDKTHLTKSDREIIETGIRNGSTKTAIAETIGKDNSTVGKEIKQRRILKHPSTTGMDCAIARDCANKNRCQKDCADFQPFKCKRRDRSPGACNGCRCYTSCRHDKYIYDAKEAHKDYQGTLTDSREGVNLTYMEAKKIGDIVSEELKKGLSPYQILRRHPDIDLCEKTLYTYIEDGIFRWSGVAAVDLRRQVSRRIPRTRKSEYKKREERAYLRGRTYKDYCAYIKENPTVLVTEMDTVYNNGTNGPFIQTFKLMGPRVLLGFLHQKKTTEEMLSGINQLEALMTPELFEKHAHVMLTDRGAEFSNPAGFEIRPDETRRSRVYYCDPMQSGQKGSIENNHILLRYICPKGVDLYTLGLTRQEDLMLVLSHVNSAPVEFLNGKSPFEYCRFMYPELFAMLLQAGYRMIPKEELKLKPALLKKRCSGC